ncbi:MAG TPA: hypothetical protein VKP30_01665 [Polyangiaceae bacterium]|nr:hypothetical protein [Polyangiaceae bacterium]
MSKHSSSLAGTCTKAVAAAMFCAACLTHGTREVALYAGAPRARDTIATLYGDIRAVDGQDVLGSGRSFELIPTCHVVTTRRRLGKVDPGWSMVDAVPDVTFIVQMRANHSYVFEYTGQNLDLMLQAREKDASGQTVRILRPSNDLNAARRCLDEASKTGTKATPGGLGRASRPFTPDHSAATAGATGMAPTAGAAGTPAP